MIYIQSDEQRTHPSLFDSACVMYGAIGQELKYRLTSFEEIQSGKFDSLIKARLFVGSVEFMNEVFSRVGIYNVRVPENSNREHELTTFGKARQRAKDGESIFIKPVGIKLFTGLVLDQSEHTSLALIPDDTPVMAYKPFEHLINSEWRVYVLNDKMIDSRNYSGDFTISPDYNYVEQVIADNKGKFPRAYTIDVGILANKENVVVEYNDMWAIGNYGIPNNLYLRALKERYFEIVQFQIG